MKASVVTWVSALVTVRQVGDLHVYRVAVGNITVLSYPSRERAEQVAAALRAVIAAAHDRRVRAGRPCRVTTSVAHHPPDGDAA